MLLFDSIVGALLQLLLFSAVPLLWWFFTARRTEGFFSWIGLTRPQFGDKRRAALIFLAAFVLLMVPGVLLVLSFEDKSVLAAARFANAGLMGLVALLIHAILQTGLSEELLFRGFLLKRLSNRFGFPIGNGVQALLFGALHAVLFFGAITTPLLVMVLAFTTAVGWLLGYLNERVGNGSILPGWALHSLANIVPSLAILLGLIEV